MATSRLKKNQTIHPIEPTIHTTAHKKAPPREYRLEQQLPDKSRVQQRTALCSRAAMRKQLHHWLRYNLDLWG